MLATVRSLLAADLDHPPPGDAVFFDLLGLRVVRWPQGASLPLAGLGALLWLVGAGRRWRRGESPGRASHWVSRSSWRSRSPQPSWAWPCTVRWRTTAMALGFIVLECARAAESGASLAECKTLAEKAIPLTGVVFAVDTLEFLHRLGRIGGAKRFLGTALNIKPILELRDGRIEALEQVRTKSKALARLAEVVYEQIGDRRPVHMATLHANAPADAKALLDQTCAKYPDLTECIFSEIRPVVGANTGPGTVGLAYMAGL